MRHVRFFRFFLLLAAFGALSRPLVAQQPDSLRLTRRQAIAEALTHNAQLDIAREQTAQARARRVQGISIPDPGLTASYDEQSRFLGFRGAASKPVELTLAVPFPDKFRLQNKIGNADVHSFESNLRLQQQLIVSQTSQDYDALLVALRRRSDLREARDLAVSFQRATQARFDAGTVARLDVIKATVDVSQSDNDLIANERDIANAQAALNHSLGRVIGAPIAPVDTLAVPPDLPDSATIEQTALANRPELEQLRHQQMGASATTALSKEFWYPDLTLGTSRDYASSGAYVYSTGIALAFPIFFWQHAKGEIAFNSHFERELDATYRDARQQVIQDVRSAYANASTAMRQVVFLRDQLVPAARTAFQVASTSYTLGGLSALEVLDTRRTLLDAQEQLSDALAAANSARADLERALGTSLTSLGARQ